MSHQCVAQLKRLAGCVHKPCMMLQPQAHSSREAARAWRRAPCTLSTLKQVGVHVTSRDAYMHIHNTSVTVSLSFVFIASIVTPSAASHKLFRGGPYCRGVHDAEPQGQRLHSPARASVCCSTCTPTHARTHTRAHTRAHARMHAHTHTYQSPNTTRLHPTAPPTPHPLPPLQFHEAAPQNPALLWSRRGRGQSVVWT